MGARGIGEMSCRRRREIGMWRGAARCCSNCLDDDLRGYLLVSDKHHIWLLFVSHVSARGGVGF